MSVGCGHRCIRPWSLMHDPRVYNATVAHVWGVSKRQVKRGKAQADVFERKILVRKVEVEDIWDVSPPVRVEGNNVRPQ
mgnify:CR=1 FL=1